MSGPSTNPNREPPAFVPHPDELEAVREAFDESPEGRLLSPEGSMVSFRWLETGEARTAITDSAHAVEIVAHPVEISTYAEQASVDVDEIGADAEQASVDVDEIGADAEQASVDADEIGADAEQASVDADEIGADAEQASVDADDIGADAEQASVDADDIGADAEQASVDADRSLVEFGQPPSPVIYFWQKWTSRFPYLSEVDEARHGVSPRAPSRTKERKRS